VIRAVFDTNALASIAVAASGPLASLLVAWKKGRVEVVVSPHILAELDHALAKPYFVTRMDAQAQEEFRRLAWISTTVVQVTAAIPEVAATRADNVVLATAESARAPYLVTGDMELLRLGKYKDTMILTPRQFSDLIDAASPGHG
jgi:uncharacterized protein